MLAQFITYFFFQAVMYSLAHVINQLHTLVTLYEDSLNQEEKKSSLKSRSFEDDKAVLSVHVVCRSH